MDKKTLVLANHQSTGDVPLLMANFNAKEGVIPNIMWIMDRLFKYTNFGAVSVIHEDFFISSVSRWCQYKQTLFAKPSNFREEITEIKPSVI